MPRTAEEILTPAELAQHDAMEAAEETTMNDTGFPKQDGYHWLLLSGESSWQIVRVLTAITQGGRRFVFFTGIGERQMEDEFEREYPEAAWGPQVLPPVVRHARREPLGAATDANDWLNCPMCGAPCYAPTANGICVHCNLIVFPGGQWVPANIGTAPVIFDPRPPVPPRPVGGGGDVG